MTAKPIHIVVCGREDHGSDAPQVKDLCNLMLRFVAFAEGVEAHGQGRKLISWRVTNLKMQSPATIEITPFCANGNDTNQRTQQVVASIANHAYNMMLAPLAPSGLDKSTVSAFDDMQRNVANGLFQADIDFSGYNIKRNIRISHESAANYLLKQEKLYRPDDLPQSESSFLEGYVLRVDQDKQQQPVILLNSRVDSQRVKCIVKGDKLRALGNRKIKEIFENLRVRVNGTIHYNSVDKIDHIDVDSFYVYPPNDSLPSEEDLFDPDFTGGLESCEYLKLIREKKNE